MSVRTAERAAASRRDASADRYRFRAHDLIPRNGRGIPRAAAGDHSNAVHDRDSRNVRGIPHAAAENPSGVTHEPVLEAARRSLHEAPGNRSHAAHDPNPRNDPDNPHAAVGSQSHSTGGQSPAAYRGSPHGATTRKVHLYHDPRTACAEPPPRSPRSELESRAEPSWRGRDESPYVLLLRSPDSPRVERPELGRSSVVLGRYDLGA